MEIYKPSSRSDGGFLFAQHV